MGKNKMKQFDYEELAIYLLDYLCLFKGVNSVIQLLITIGYDADQLEDLGFDREDVNQIIESEK